MNCYEEILTMKVVADFFNIMENNKENLKIEFPIINSLKDISSDIKIEILILNRMLKFPEIFYREFSIPKRNGQKRNIKAPYPVIDLVQRYILNNILKKIDISNYATGFVEKKSILDNVSPHINSTCFLKLDIENFFPSISINRVIPIFQNLKYKNSISYCLAKFCTLNNSLPQGACTSPYISNIIAKGIDHRIVNIVTKYNLIYTRYADDIIISGAYIPNNLVGFLESVINEEGFKLNAKKTKLLLNRNHVIITGISINNSKLTLPRKTKRQLRKDAYYILQNGLITHQEKTNNFDPILLERLIGKFNFWKFIEAENEYVNNTIDKLNIYSKELDGENINAFNN